MTFPDGTTARERREQEIARLLKEPGVQDALEKLSAAGCDRDNFVRGLLALAVLISFEHSADRKERYLFPSGKEIRKLSEDIKQLAARVERANADPIVSPAVVLDALTRPRNLETDKKYTRQVRTYRALPLLLRAYADDVLESYRIVTRRVGPKRFSFERYLVQKLLEHVNSQTGQPHYESVQCLLESAFRVTAGKETPIPKLLESPDALKQLWARSLKYGFRKKTDTSGPSSN